MSMKKFPQNRQACAQPANAPARRELSSGEAVPSLIRPSWHPNAGNTVRDICPKQVLVPLAGALAFVLSYFAAVYLGFHYLVFDLAYHGDPAVFGEAYRDARVVTRMYDRQFNQEVFVLETADGGQKILAFDSSDFHPGRYRHPARELSGVPATGGFVSYTLYRNFWAWLEIALMLLIAPAALALSLLLSRRIKSKDKAEEKPRRESSHQNREEDGR